MTIDDFSSGDRFLDYHNNLASSNLPSSFTSNSSTPSGLTILSSSRIFLWPLRGDDNLYYFPLSLPVMLNYIVCCSFHYML